MTFAWFSFDGFVDPYDENGNTTVDPDYDREAYRCDPDAPVDRTVERVVGCLEEEIEALGLLPRRDVIGKAVRDWIVEANHNVDEPWTDRNLSIESEDEREIEYVGLAVQMKNGGLIEEVSYNPLEVE